MGNIIHPNYNPYEDHNGCLPWVIGCLLVCIFLFSGCRTKYIPVPVESTDSIVIRDTIIDVQLVPYSDSVIVVPEPTKRDSVASFLYNPYAWSWAQWMNGRLHHSLNIWPNKLNPIRVPYYYERIKRVEVPKIVEVEIPLTRWQSFKMEFGGISFGVCVGLMIVIAYLIWRKRKI